VAYTLTSPLAGVAYVCSMYVHATLCRMCVYATWRGVYIHTSYIFLLTYVCLIYLFSYLFVYFFIISSSKSGRQPVCGAHIQSFIHLYVAGMARTVPISVDCNAKVRRCRQIRPRQLHWCEHTNSNLQRVIGMKMPSFRLASCILAQASVHQHTHVHARTRTRTRAHTGGSDSSVCSVEEAQPMRMDQLYGVWIFSSSIMVLGVLCSIVPRCV
jgi:hypothetical protein